MTTLGSYFSGPFSISNSNPFATMFDPISRLAHPCLQGFNEPVRTRDCPEGAVCLGGTQLPRPLEGWWVDRRSLQALAPSSNRSNATESALAHASQATRGASAEKTGRVNVTRCSRGTCVGTSAGAEAAADPCWTKAGCVCARTEAPFLIESKGYFLQG